MGVKGLWQLLQATGHPVTLESLEGKILTVDVSIWLNQTIKGMRDKDGNPLPNAHLLGLFHRVCKLLFYGIKPIFVFDGGVPTLKKKTLIARRQRKEFASNKSERATKDILENLLKHHALKAVLGTPGRGTANTAVVPVPSTSQQEKPDLFELPPLPVPLEQHPEVTDDHAWEERMDQRSVIHAEFQNLSDIDIHSEDFTNLPPEIKHEILTDLKESDRQNNWARLHEMPQESNEFSNFQLERLKLRSVLSKQLVDVRKEMNIQSSGEIVHVLTGSQSAGIVESRKLASEDSSHYILIKGLSKAKQQEEQVKLEQGSATLGGASTSSHDTERKDAERKILELTKEGKDIVDILKSEKALKEKLDNYSVTDNTAAESEVKMEDDSGINRINECSTNSFDLKNIQEKAVFSSGEIVTVINNSDDSKDSTAVNLCGKGANLIKDEVIIGSSDEDCEIVEVIDQETGEVSLVDEEDFENAGGFIRDESEDENQGNDSVTKDKSVNSEQFVNSTNKNQSRHDQQTTGVTVSLSNSSKTKSMTGESEKLATQKLSSKDFLKVTITTANKSILNENNSKTNENNSKSNENNSKLSENNSAEDRRIGSVNISEISPVKSSSLPENKKSVETIADDSSSSDGEDFIEIEINPDAAKDDELFPASIFMTADDISTKRTPLIFGQDSEKLVDVTVEDNEFKVADVAEEDLVSIPEDAEEDDGNASRNDDVDDVDVIIPDDLQVVNDANEFEGMSREELVELQTVLMSESSQLNQERGKQQRMASSVTEQMTLEAQDLLRLFGVPFIISPMEAEAQCAYLDFTDQAQGSVTDDSDIWLFGGRRVYKNFFNQNKHVEFYKLEDISKQLFLDKEKLISLALICGSDYTEGVEGLGPVHGMEILQEFEGEGMTALRNFKKWWEGTRKQLMPPIETKLKGRLRKILLSEGFPSQEVFNAYLKPEVDESAEKFTWGKPDLDLLRQYTKHKFGWNKTKSDEELLPVIKKVNSGHTQQHITSFFLPTQLETEPRKLKSRRVKRVLKRLRNPDEEEAEQDDVPAKKNSQNEAQKRTQKEAQNEAQGRTQKEAQNGRGKRGRGRGQTRGRGKVCRSAAVRNDTVQLSESSSDDERVDAKATKSGVVNLSESDSDSDASSEKTASASVKVKSLTNRSASSRGRISKSNTNRGKRR